MKLVDQVELTGAVHKITLGRRVKKDAQGRERPRRGYIARWFERGREKSKALGTNSLPAAKRLAMALDHDLSAGRGLPPKSVSVGELVDEYLGIKLGQGRARTTMRAYEHALHQWRDWLPSQTADQAARLTDTSFWDFGTYLRDDQGLSAKTCAFRLTVLKQVTRWAEQSGRLACNPFKGQQVPDPPPTRQPCFTPEQVAKLLQHADQRMRAIVMVLVHTGIRFGELRDLRWDRIDLTAQIITIDAGGSGSTTKNRRARTLPLHEDLFSTLSSLPRLGERVFYQLASTTYPQGDHPLVESHLLKSFKALCKRAGFADWQKYKLHTCRHTFASMLARNHQPSMYGLAFMGHKESRVLDLYFKQYDDVARTAINSIQYGAADRSSAA